MDVAFVEFVKEQIAAKLGCAKGDIYTVWQCKTLQNIKGLFSSDVPEAKGLYFEATYNGDKGELYLDTYRKESNQCFNI